MSKNSGDLLMLIQEFSKLKLKLRVNLKILKHDLECSDKFISWLPLLTDELEKYTDITRLNLFEKVKLLVEIGKYLPKILKLKDDLTNALTSKQKLTPKLHVNAARPINIEKNVEEQNTNSINTIQKQYYPSDIANFVRSLDKCDVSTVRLRPKGIIECLLCHSKILYSNMSNVRGHMCSKNHLSKVSEDYQNLVEFHKFWQRQTPETWKKHLKFNYASHCLSCVVCRKNVKYLDVVDHLVTCPGPPVRQNSDLGKTNKGKRYGLRVVYKDVPSIKIGDDIYPTFQRLPVGQYGKGFICLVCNEHLKGLQSRSRHANSIDHIQRQVEQTVQESLVRYHRTWSVLPIDMQYRQTHFERGPDRMKCRICPDTFIDYDSNCVRRHLMSLAHPSRGEIRNLLMETWRDREYDPTTAVGSTNKTKKKKQARKSQISSETASVTPSEILHQEPANLFPPIPDINKADLNEREYEPPRKRIKIEEGATEPMVHRIQEKTQPSHIYFDYNGPDFIPLTGNSPKVTSELVSNPIMVKTEPRDNDYNEPDFIPLTRNTPKVTSKFVLNPIMVKTEPIDNDTNVVDGFY